MQIGIKFPTGIHLINQMLNFTAGRPFDFRTVVMLRLVISVAGMKFY